jgi:uncharacterized protein YqgV (UPF0045/DUF77 family)
MKDYNKIYSQEEIKNINILIKRLKKELKENKDKFSINQMVSALQKSLKEIIKCLSEIKEHAKFSDYNFISFFGVFLTKDAKEKLLKTKIKYYEENIEQIKQYEELSIIRKI